MAQLKIDHSVLEDENIIYIQNDRIRLGVNLSLGGAVTYLAHHGKPNLINSYDWGRQVQMSFYSHPVPFKPEGYEMNEGWWGIGWNPIQSGDCYGHRSTVLEHRATENEIYVKCIPMHWPLDNHPGECTFETWYRLNGDRVDITARINNARPDTAQYPARGQELPAVYTNGPWYKLVSYLGDAPFTGGAVTELCNKENLLGWPWVTGTATEHWMALVDEDYYGLGVYNGITTKIDGGFAGTMGIGGPKDANTGYIAPYSNEILDHDIVFTYDYSLIVGTVPEIRAHAAQLQARQPGNAWNFEKDRCHFYYRGITDGGWRTDGCLNFDFRQYSALCGPQMFCRREDLHTLTLDAIFTGGDIPVTVAIAPHIDRTAMRGSQAWVICCRVVLNGDGQRRQYSIPMTGAHASIQSFELVFEKAGHAQIYSVRLD